MMDVTPFNKYSSNFKVIYGSWLVHTSVFHYMKIRERFEIIITRNST